MKLSVSLSFNLYLPAMFVVLGTHVFQVSINLNYFYTFILNYILKFQYWLLLPLNKIIKLLNRIN